MCKGAVAAPRPLQALVYPILQEKSLPFCEKIKKTEILNENTSDCFKDSGSGIAAHGHTFIAVGKGDLQRMPRCVQGAVLVFGQRNPGFRKTDLLRLEGFKVAFFLWFYADYLVMELDRENYRYAVVGSSSDRYLWILGRDRNMSPEVLEFLIDRLHVRGYDTDKLIFTAQEVVWGRSPEGERLDYLR